ncbi:MAG: terminase [Alphaproteobacteria bacterium]
MSLARDLVRAIDPVALMADVGLVADPWQAAVLRSRAPRKALACCRQSGKSTTAATKALAVSLYEPGALTLMLSPSLRQSAELFKTTADYYRVLDGVPDPAAESALRLELPNRSRIVSLPGSSDTIRGFSRPRLLIVDEAAYCSDGLLSALLPMIAASPDSELLVMSSPGGTRGWFYTLFTSDESFEKTKIVWTDCPRIGADAVELYRRTAGEMMYRQEFMAEFVDADAETVFPSHLIDAAFTDSVVPLW